MSTDDVIAEWYFNDLIGHRGKLPSPSFGLFYMKCLMDIVAADGVISDEERQWIIGFAAISGKTILINISELIWDHIGYQDDVIQQIEAYKPAESKEGVTILEHEINRDYVKLNRLSLIYNAFRAAGADGIVHEKEAEAICALGKKLGATDEQIQQVQVLYDDEVKLRKKRATTLVPKSLDTVLNEFKKHH